MKWRGISDTEPEAVKGTLRDELAERCELMRRFVPKETLEINERAVEEIKNSGLLDQVLNVGEKAPEFSLRDVNGKAVSSADLLVSGPLVISFFRGRWCPFCVGEAEALNRALPEMQAAGASLVAISPHTVQQSDFMRDQHKLRFPLLSDPGNKVAAQFGLAYRIPEYQQKLFTSVFINLPHVNGEESWTLPIPATFILNQDGTVRWRWVNADYTERAEPSEIVAQLGR